MNSGNLTELERRCEIIARKAGEVLLAHLDRPLDIAFKGRFDMVTQADLASEDLILNELAALTPDIPVLSEERNASKPVEAGADSGLCWVVDPLDGTTNFAHGVPHFCISIALVDSGSPLLGVIYNPCNGELFHSIRQMGAFVNDRKCAVSGVADLEHSLVVTGFPYKIRELAQNNLIEFCAFRLRAQGVRRFGAAALDLAYIACGRFDGYWERWLKPWDTAAGILMVSESGGTVSAYDGSEYSIHIPEILATNGRIHQEMIRVLLTKWPVLPNLLVDE